MELTTFNFMSDIRPCGHSLMLDGLIVRSDVELSMYHVEINDDNPRESVADHIFKVCFQFTEKNVEILTDAYNEEILSEIPTVELTPLDVALVNGYVTDAEYKSSAPALDGNIDGPYLKALRKVLRRCFTQMIEDVASGEIPDDADIELDPLSIGSVEHFLGQGLIALAPDALATRITHSIVKVPFQPIKFEVVTLDT